MNQFSARRYVIMLFVILIGLVFIIRLFALQVLDPTYKISATSNAQRIEILYPSRGLIYDRHGELLVYNEAAYDLMVTPGMLGAFDTLDFCTMLDIDKQRLVSGLQKARSYSRMKPSVLLKQVSSETYAILQEKLYKYPGFFVQPRTLRKYPSAIAAHILGYVGEVDDQIIKTGTYYQMGDYYGVSGVEHTYEEVLRGEKGRKVYLVDVHNRIKGSFQDGQLDRPSAPGSNITLTIDKELQTYAEYLMQKFRGSVVAIEPSSGGILSMVSMPAYDPSLLVGRKRTENFRRLQEDTLKPLFNRALMARYPPGSTFKPINGLIGLQEKVITPRFEYYCDNGFHYGSIHVACHYHVSPLDIVGATKNSCNAYFNEVFRRILTDPKYGSTEDAYKNWRRHVMSFGLGQKLGSDMSYELPGSVPEASLYHDIYGRGRWNFLTVRSLSIGQGELGVTPIQMANMAAAIANRGYYYTPHLMKSIEGDPSSRQRFSRKHHTTIDSSNFEYLVDGMDLAVNGGSGGTAWRARVRHITVCGKTGTAENPHGADHSIFIAFAPKEEPKIAVSVYVENGGFGNIWASPIASLIIEKYLTDSISRTYMEEYVLKAENLGKEE